MKLLVTGTNGFVGRLLLQKLLDFPNIQLNLVIRKRANLLIDDRINYFFIDDIATEHSWDQMLEGCDVVIHVAGRAHILKDTVANSLSEFRKINRDVTVNLAKQAAAKGVKRFIFLSTIGVHGAETFGVPINEETLCDPKTPYTRSKFEAEVELFKLAETTNMEIVIIRPPLVYAADAPGNFGKLLKLVSKQIILPFGSLNNKRSFISRDNLVDFICCCIDHPMAKNQAFVIADNDYISTCDLVNYLRKGMGVSSKVIPFPISVMQLFCKILRKEGVFKQLYCSLEIDNSKAKRLLAWEPKFSIRDSLLKVGAMYKKSSSPVKDHSQYN